MLALFEEFQARSSAPQGRRTETNIVLARTSRLCLLPLNLGQSTEKLQDMWEFITVIFFKMSMKNKSFSPVEFEWQHYDMYIELYRYDKSLDVKVSDYVFAYCLPIVVTLHAHCLFPKQMTSTSKTSLSYLRLVAPTLSACANGACNGGVHSP